MSFVLTGFNYISNVMLKKLYFKNVWVNVPQIKTCIYYYNKILLRDNASWNINYFICHIGYVNLNFSLFHLTVIYLNKLVCLRDLFERLNFSVIAFIWSHISLFMQLSQMDANGFFRWENKHCYTLDNDQPRFSHSQKWWRLQSQSQHNNTILKRMNLYQFSKSYCS